jgi:DNA-binding response OmpR family regulator
MAESSQEPALLLIATEGEWAGRSLESVLTDRGYAVLRTQNGRGAVELARRTKPDAVILDEHMQEISGIDVCRMLRDDPTFDAATPIVVMAGSPASPADRAAAYAAGAWTFSTQPLDTDILLQELSTFIRAKRAVSAAREKSLVDPSTGLLNPVGLERWAEQLAARAVRNHEPLACVVLMAPAEASAADNADLAEIAAAFVESSRPHMRRSDIVGLTSDGRLALLAPDTDDAGALGLVQRLRTAIDATAKTREAGGRTSAGFRAGYCAIDDFSSGAVEAPELLRRATRAVDHASRFPDGALTLSFSQVPLS